MQASPDLVASCKFITDPLLETCVELSVPIWHRKQMSVMLQCAPAAGNGAADN